MNSKDKLYIYAGNVNYWSKRLNQFGTAKSKKDKAIKAAMEKELIQYSNLLKAFSEDEVAGMFRFLAVRY